MNIINVHDAVLGLLDRYSLPVIGRSMLDSFILAAIDDAVNEVLGDLPFDSKIDPVNRLRLDSIAMKILKEYVKEANHAITGNVIGANDVFEISEDYIYAFDFRLVTEPGGYVMPTPIDYGDLIDVQNSPFDFPTINYPKSAYVATSGNLVHVLKDPGTLLKKIEYRYIERYKVNSGEEVLAGESIPVTSKAIVIANVNNDVATYDGNEYESGAEIINFDSSKLTNGSVVVDFDDIVIPQRIKMRVISNAATMIDSFFNKNKKQ